jgi:ribosomal protein S18 acetylase RimI-like enzyme
MTHSHLTFATEADYAYLAARDQHVSPAILTQKITRGEIIMLYDDADARPIGWLRFGYFWDELPFMNLIQIEDSYRRQGYGTQLITFWEDAMRRQNHACVLTSSLANEQAQHLYRRLGYIDCGALLLPGEALEIIFRKAL